jgi:hypothetical protein
VPLSRQKDHVTISIIKLHAEPGIDAVKALRRLLKVTLRQFGLRAIEAREEADMSAYRDKINKQKDEQGGVYKIADFQNGTGKTQEFTHTIESLVEDVPMFDREVDILNFENSNRQLVVNIIIADILMDLFGDDPQKDWPGKRITIYLTEYAPKKFSFRVRAADASAPARSAPPAVRPKPDFDDEIPI